MVDKIEMSLDDIIKSNRGQKKPGGGRGAAPGAGVRRGGGRPAQPQRKGRGRLGVVTPRKTGGGPAFSGVLKGRNRGGILQKAKLSRGDVNSAWKHDMYDGPKRGGGGGGQAAGGILRATGESGKLLVSNLDYGVSDADILELFSEFGPLKKTSVHYDRSGRSLGTADVLFERRSDALKAIKQYNGVPLDGRPMNIQLATSDVTALTRSGRLGTRGGSNVSPIKRRLSGGKAPIKRGVSNRRGAPNRGASAASGAGGRRATKGPAPTAEELDAELDAYVNDMKI